MALHAPTTECVAVIGLGYVGLHLAVAFGRIAPTVGFDVNRQRIEELRSGYDRNGEFTPEALQVPYLNVAHDSTALSHADFFIVAVPTPVDEEQRIILSNLIEASRIVGRVLKARSFDAPAIGRPPIVVYESTVYPGCTEEVCIPVLEQESGLKGGQDFGVGYCPERLNPADADHTLDVVVKVISAQDTETLEVVAQVYQAVVKAGICRAPNIRTAEAAKVIENIQRDSNIALMNEFSMIFHRLGLDTQEVLKVARTKWNFLDFKPGLVGGDCIPVVPYFLIQKAQEVGYSADMMRIGRRINESMASYIGQETAKLLTHAGKVLEDARALVLGVAFKEDVRDLRNSKVLQLIRELQCRRIDVEVYDPLVDTLALQNLGFKVIADPFQPNATRAWSGDGYDALILSVPHKVFRNKPMEAYLALLRHRSGPPVLVDVKAVLSESIRGSEVLYWRL